jgi:hypothetical protein
MLSPQNGSMQRLFLTAVSRHFPRGRMLPLGVTLLACCSPLLADTSALLRSVRAGGCYCHCEEAHRRAGCVKICDSKKYVARWWATTCAKPHMQTPAQDSNAGPRFPHPGRAEHARLEEQ